MQEAEIRRIAIPGQPVEEKSSQDSNLKERSRV
jgi:hypothetical protein